MTEDGKYKIIRRKEVAQNRLKTNFSVQPFSPSISAALTNSPAAINISLK